jgi:hypothetical protein
MSDYEIVEMWDHQWMKLRKENPEIVAYLNSIHFVESLRAREALQGGRTETIALYRHIIEQLQEMIKYLDVNSLYPYVMKYKSYPIGFPDYITENFNYSLYFYFGIMKATLLPPRKLFFPVLPAKVGKKLVFTLCPVCADAQTKLCLHSEKERLMTGVWVTEEIYLAVKKGNFGDFKEFGFLLIFIC